MTKVLEDIPYRTEGTRTHSEIYFEVEGQTIIVVIGKEDCQDPDCHMVVRAVLQEEGD